MALVEIDGKRIPFYKLPKEQREEILQMQRESVARITAKEADERYVSTARSLNTHETIGTQGYVKWGGEYGEITGRMHGLGFDYGRAARTPKRGFRRAVYDFCYGYVSGFPVRDIIWYLFTRSLNYRKYPGYLKKWEKEHGYDG